MKIAALEAAGIRVAPSPAALGETLVPGAEGRLRRYMRRAAAAPQKLRGL